MATFDVLLPVKNGLPYLRESIESIQQQTFSDWRLFILDHASTDGSLELADRYAERDPRIVVKSCSPDLTFSQLLNLGLAFCDARYVLRQDADDISLPYRMATLAHAFCEMRDITLLGSQGFVIDAYGKKTGRFDMPLSPERIAAISFFRIPVLHPSAALRFSDIARFGIQYGEDFTGAMPDADRLSVPALAEDYFLFGQLALSKKCRNLEQRLLAFRWHQNNISIAKEVDQTTIAIGISRYLAKTFARIHNTEEFDPAPFCNHGHKLVDMKEQTDFRDHYSRMKTSLIAGLSDSPELRRELAFRNCLNERATPPILRRYGVHAFQAGVDRSEWYTVKSWLLSAEMPRYFAVPTRPLVEID